jgi:MFS family permease
MGTSATTAAGVETAEGARSGRSSDALWPTPRAGWYTVIVLTLVGMLAQVDRGVMALLVQPMKRDLDLTDTQVSLLIGFAFTFFYIMVGPPMSRVTDRANRSRVVLFGLTLWSIATSLCGFAQGFWSLFFARALVGAGESVNGPASLSIVADCVRRDKLPRAYAVLNAGIMAGIALSMVIGGLIMGLLQDVKPFHVPGIGLIRNWQLVFFIVGLPGLLMSLLMFFTVKEPIRKGVHRKGGVPFKEVVRTVWGARAIHLPLLGAMTISSIQVYGLGAWGPAFYERSYGWGPAMSGPLLGTLSLVSAPLGLILGTKLAERLGRVRDDANLRVLFFAQLLPIPFGFLGPLMPSPWLALGCAGIAGVFGVMGGPSYNAAIQIVTPNEMRGQVNALYLFAISAIGGGIGPTAVALVTDNLAGNEGNLRYVLSGFRIVLGPIAVLLLWQTLKPYALAYRRAVATSD